MGRTFEVLGGRSRRSIGGDPAPAIPFPTIEPDPLPDPVKLVPVTEDDLPGDDNAVPFIEVGGKRASVEAPPAPTPAAPPSPAPVVTPAAPPVPPVRLEGANDYPTIAYHLIPDAQVRQGTPAADLITYHRPEHPTSRQYRQLADGILVQHHALRSPVLLFTPVTCRPYAATAVVNLAAIRAADGTGRILVIEAEAAPGSAAERLGAASLPGLRELLARTVPTSLAIHRTAIDGVQVIPEGKTRIGEEEYRRLPTVLEQLRSRFDWILVDAPIWNARRLEEWTRASDGIYLVLGPDEWSSPHADAAAEGIEQAGGKLRGCVTTGMV